MRHRGGTYRIIIVKPNKLGMILKAKSSYTIRDIKTQIEDKMGHPINHQRLIYHEHTMKDDMTLKEGGIFHLNVLDLEIWTEANINKSIKSI